MNKGLQLLLTVFSVLVLQSKSNAQCPVGGTATATLDSICENTQTTLILSGYTGNIQWQSNTGSGWVNETGTGFNTDNYTVTVGQVTDFRALLTLVACPDDSSTVVTVTTGILPTPSGIGASRCGIGTVSLTGTGSGTLKWYTAPTGGSPVGTGSPFTPFISSTTTFYLEDNLNGGSGSNSPIQITELDLGGSDYLEIQNVSAQAIDVTGWKLAINNSYTDINAVNANLQTLSGVMQPGDIITYTDNAAGPNYWGSNMLWNPGVFPTFTGWAMIIDSTNALKDFVVLNWPDVNIQGMTPLVNGVTITIGSQWSGNGIDISTVAAGSGVSRQGNIDTDTLADFTVTAPLSIGATNSVMTLPFSGFGCSSIRVPIVATSTFADAVTINASATALCQGTSANLSATSANGSYNYTWSPATGLNTTTGPNVIATPLSPITYVVIGNDGTCANSDTVSINVGPASVAGAALNSPDTICFGKFATLTLTGSTGTVQWQSNNGSGWVNETNQGFDSTLYQVSPPAFTQYRAVVTSGGCAPDTSLTLSIEVVTISDPTTTNISICGPDTVTMNASGPGNLNWYMQQTGGNSVNLGSTYTTYVPATITYYVQASAGGFYNVGAANLGIGSSGAQASTDFGMQFDATRACTIEKVYVYVSNAPGNITVNLRASAGGPILGTVTQAVAAFGVFVPVPLGFTVNPGTGYRLELATGSANLYRNTAGAVYPYTATNSPIDITGYFNPNFASGTSYYYFYNWEVSDGCSSNRIPLTVTVNPFPPVPTISQNFNSLMTQPAAQHQWYLNGVPIPGGTAQTIIITQTGTYTVVVTDPNGCSTTSAPFIVTVVSLTEIADAQIQVYPNPANDKLFLVFGENKNSFNLLQLFDLSGKEILKQLIIGNPKTEIDLKNISAGAYLLKVSGKENSFQKEIMVVR